MLPDLTTFVKAEIFRTWGYAIAMVALVLRQPFQFLK
jgi:hypothetical protein